MFKLKRLSKEIIIQIECLQMFFSDIQWLHFKSLLISLLLTPHKKTISGMAKVLDFGAHRSKRNAFVINHSAKIQKALNYYSMMILSLLKKPGEPVYLIIDDSSNKKTGKHIQAAFKIFDHITKRFVLGQQIVCSIIHYRGFNIPYDFDIYVPKEHCSKLGIRFRKKTEIALDQVKSFEADNDQKIFVVADSYYACQSIMNYCRDNNLYFVSSIRYNRVFYIKGHQTNASKYLKYSIKNFKHSQKVTIGKKTFKAVSRKVDLKTGGAAKLVFTKHSAHCTAMVLVTTGTALPFNNIIEAYQKRWNIETFFKMSKQHLGFNSYQSRELSAINSSIALSMLSYNLLTHVFISELRAKRKSLTKKNISKFSISSMLSIVRYQVNINNIDYCIDHLSTKSKNKIKNELKSLINIAA
jgi:SRSO17 transposase